MGLLVPTSYEIPPLGGTPAAPVGQPTPIAAGGGSIVNTGTVTLIFSTTSNPNPPNQISIAPGGTLPWPSNQPCWCWASPGSNVTGQCSVVPLPLSFSPGPGATESILYTGLASDPSVTVNLTQSNVGYLKIVGPNGLAIPITTGKQSNLLYVAYETSGHLLGGEQIWIIPIDPAVDQSYSIAWAGGSALESYDVLSVYGTSFSLVYDVALSTIFVADGTAAGGSPEGIPISGLDRASDTYQNVEVDQNGRLVPLVPTITAFQTSIGTGGTTMIPAPASGGNYLFWANPEQPSGMGLLLAITDGGTLRIGIGPNSVSGPFVNLNGYRVTTAVSAATGSGTTDLAIAYAPGP